MAIGIGSISNSKTKTCFDVVIISLKYNIIICVFQETFGIKIIKSHHEAIVFFINVCVEIIVFLKKSIQRGSWPQ